MGAGQEWGGPGAGGQLGTVLCVALVWDLAGLRGPVFPGLCLCPVSLSPSTHGHDPGAW